MKHILNNLKGPHSVPDLAYQAGFYEIALYKGVQILCRRYTSVISEKFPGINDFLQSK
jgi:hypothetical protein